MAPIAVVRIIILCRIEKGQAVIWNHKNLKIKSVARILQIFGIYKSVLLRRLLGICIFLDKNRFFVEEEIGFKNLSLSLRRNSND